MTDPYYSDELVTLYLGDCLDVVPTLGLFDLVFTSPPYNLGTGPWAHLGNWKPTDGRGTSKWDNGSKGGGGIVYDEHDDTMPWDEYVAWQQHVLTVLWAHLTEDGAIFYNHKPRLVGGHLWTPMELLPTCVSLRQIVVWARAGGLNYNPTAYVPTHEWVMILAREAWRLKSKAASGLGDVWRVPQEPSPHPAPFPVALPAGAIETTGPGSVLDPFAGSGSTLVAAKRAGVPAVGIEKSERYCEMAVDRLAQGVLAL